MILIMGADGLLGNSLLKDFNSSGMPAIGTTRNKKNIKENVTYFDAMELFEAETVPKNVNLAVFCIGNTKIAECENNVAETMLLN
ncbi:hypothetical protein DRO91_08750, partial [Candidatus Heimdallarchaeota archaeon]